MTNGNKVRGQAWRMRAPRSVVLLLRLLGRHFDLLSAALIASVLLYAVVRAAYDEGFHLADRTVSGQVRDLLWFSLLCGLASFATLEAVKRLTPVRAKYHVWRTRRWFGRRLAGNGDRAFVELRRAMGLTAGGRAGGRSEMESPTFGLPTEQLVAQITAAADLALTVEGDHPREGRRYEWLIAGLTGNPLDQPDKPHRTEPDDARRALQVRLGIDQLQIMLTTRWRRHLWSAALALAGLYGIGLTYAGRETGSDEPRNVVAALVIGGVLAAVARDLMAIAERLRG